MQGGIREKYDLDQSETIGEGSFAKVIKGREKKTGKLVAIKVIKKQKMNQEEQILLQREIHIMKNIQHPNIVEFYDYFIDQKYIYLVLEYLSGGQLYDEIAEKVVYTEEQARNVICPIIDAIRYLHQCGIVHRDLKPQNCVFSSRSQDRVIKLIDFGVSQIIPDQTHLMSSLVGTPLYMAPEILSGKRYNEEVDWWAIGVILYVLLCGYPPFEGDNQTDLKKQIYSVGVKFDPDDWENISEEAQDLVGRLLAVDQSKRIKVQDIMDHPWMLTEAKREHLPSVQQNIKKFKSKVRVVLNAIKVVGIMQSLRKQK